MNPNQPSMFMPFPMFMQQPQQQRETEQVPKRVSVALHLWHEMSNQLSPGLAANDVGFEAIEPRQLEVEEKELFVSVCKLLTNYLQGGFKLTKDEERIAKEQKQGRRTFMRCPACGGTRHFQGKTCDLCEGGGSLMVQPADNGEG